MRGTQSLLSIQVECWRRPGLTARELTWRWLFGIPALCVVSLYARRIGAALPAAHTGIEDFSLQQPVAAAHILRLSYGALRPQLIALWWLAPLLLVGWALVSGLGRVWVFRVLAPGARSRPVTMALLQLLRVMALAVSWWTWFVLVRWAASREIFHLSRGPGAEPNLVTFAAWLICLSLAGFVVWALWSWMLSIAVVLLVVEGRSLPAALAGSLCLGRLVPKLMEVNLVLGIVKLALIVLAMVFSAIPLPFEAQMSGSALHLWYVLVGIWYLAASDFFQVVRLAAFVDFRRRSQSAA